MKKCITGLIPRYHGVRILFEEFTKPVIVELIRRKLIEPDIEDSPTFDKIMGSYLSGFEQLTQLEEIRERSHQLILACYELSGPFERLGIKLGMGINREMQEKFNFQFKWEE